MSRRHVIPNIAWNGIPDWDLQASDYKEIWTPFHRLVKLEKPTGHVLPTFPQFEDLPVEMKLLVLQCCDMATLFHLMHVSSALRIEARKLFWGNSEAWFRIDGMWLLGSSAWPGHEIIAMDMLPFIEQVEVDFGDSHILAHLLQYRKGTAGSLYTKAGERIALFWKGFQQILPSARRVVLSDSRVENPGDGFPFTLRAMAEGRPSGMVVSASFLYAHVDSNLLERQLWRPTWDTDGGPVVWDMIDPSWKRLHVLPPTRKFQGIIGAYKSARYEADKRQRLKTAATIFKFEAIERHHFHKRHEPYTCFAPRCRARFDQPGAYLHHTLEEHWDLREAVPGPLKDAFAEHDAIVLYRYLNYSKEPMDRFGEDWCNEDDDYQRKRTMTREFLDQLENDPLYKCAFEGKDSVLWRDFEAQMYFFSLM